MITPLVNRLAALLALAALAAAVSGCSYQAADFESVCRASWPGRYMIVQPGTPKAREEWIPAPEQTIAACARLYAAGANAHLDNQRSRELQSVAPGLLLRAYGLGK